MCVGQISQSLVWNISLGTFSGHVRIWCNSCNSCKNTPKQFRGFRNTHSFAKAAADQDLTPMMARRKETRSWQTNLNAFKFFDCVHRLKTNKCWHKVKTIKFQCEHFERVRIVWPQSKNWTKSKLSKQTNKQTNKQTKVSLTLSYDVSEITSVA